MQYFVCMKDFCIKYDYFWCNFWFFFLIKFRFLATNAFLKLIFIQFIIIFHWMNWSRSKYKRTFLYSAFYIVFFLYFSLFIFLLSIIWPFYIFTFFILLAFLYFNFLYFSLSIFLLSIFWPILLFFMLYRSWMESIFYVKWKTK